MNHQHEAIQQATSHGHPVLGILAIICSWIFVAISYMANSVLSWDVPQNVLHLVQLISALIASLVSILAFIYYIKKLFFKKYNNQNHK